MPSALPPILSSCFESCLAFPSQSLVTSVLNANADWLVIRLLAAITNGTDYEHQTPSHLSERHDTENGVVLISFLRPLDLWVEIGKKINLDVPRLIAKRKLVYIDGLTSQDTSQSTSNVQSHPLRSHSLEDVSKAITSALQSFSQTAGSAHTKRVIILDAIDYVLASRPEIDSGEMSRFLLSLQQNFANVILKIHADAPLLHSTDATCTPLELNHGVFLRLACYHSSLVMQVRPLETGTAQDVSGVLRVSHGGTSSSAAAFSDGEWLYHVKGDGSLRLWGRGE